VNNLDSLQNASSQLPPQAAGSRLSDTSSVGGGAEANVRLLTPSGNALPQQAKPAQQSAIQQTEEIEVAVEKLASFAQSLQRALSFSVDDITGQTILVVTDSESEEVVRQIPSEELVQLARKLQELEATQEKLSESTGNLLEVKV